MNDIGKKLPDMIDRVSHALEDCKGEPFRIMAVAAISAMREPTEEMMYVACDGPSKRARECWKCMINEALK